MTEDAPPRLPIPYRVLQALLLTALYAGPAVVALSRSAVQDPDIWWHLRTAAWIISHHRWPHTDPFSASVFGHPWTAYSWGFDLLLYGLYRAFGLVGIVAYNTAMVLAITLALHRLVRTWVANFTATVALTAAGMFAIAAVFTPRSWLFTILFFILELHIIAAARSTGDWRQLWPLVPLFAVWTNFHLQFIYGLAVLALAGLEPFIERLLKLSSQPRQAHIPPAKLWGMLAACSAATLVNPYGIYVYRPILEYTRQQGEIYKYVQELQPLPFRDLGSYLLLLLALGAAFFLGSRMTSGTNRPGPFPVLLLVMAAVLAFRARRDEWLLAVVAVAIITGAGYAPPSQGSPTFRTRAFSPIPAVMLLLLLSAHLRRINNHALPESLQQSFPVQAVKFIGANGLRGPLLNPYDWGGYLIWELPSIPVSLDGRADLYAREHLQHSIDLWTAQSDWQADRELAQAGVVLGQAKAPLCSLLRFDPRFQLVYEDKMAAVFVAKMQASRVASSVVPATHFHYIKK